MKQIVLALSLLVAAPALAIADGDFSKMDANGDGLISIDELRASGINISEDAFSGADADSDDTLSEAEFDSYSADND